MLRSTADHRLPLLDDQPLLHSKTMAADADSESWVRLPVSTYDTSGALVAPHSAMTLASPPVGPSQADEVAFINGINPNGTATATSFWTWNYDNPATYASKSGAAKWGANTAGTTSGTIEYYFKDASNFSDTEKGVIKSALALWSAVANIHFVEASVANGADLTFRRGHDGSAYEFDQAGTVAVGSNHVATKAAAAISIDTSVPGFGPMDGSFTAFGGYVWGTIIHEIGHALGLGHAGAYNGDVNAKTQQFSAYDTLAWTIMSYIEPGQTNAKYFSSYPMQTAWGISPDGYTNTPTTMMALDIVALQQLYGAPTTSALGGNQTFGFNTNITGDIARFYDFTINVNPIVTIFSTGTNNTLDLSGFTTDATVDLNSGTFSSCDGLTNNLCIAYGTAIDKYVGTTAKDTVTANSDADTINTGKGADQIVMGANLTAQDALNGGGQKDVVSLNGDYNLTFGANTMRGIETMTLASGHDYSMITHNNTVKAGATLTVNASALLASDQLVFNASTETDGHLTIKSGAGDDTLTGGALGDIIKGGAGADTIKGGLGADVLSGDAGNDLLVYGGANESTGAAFDTLQGFDFHNADHIKLPTAVTKIDATIASGALSSTNFDTNLAAAADAAHLGAHHAVLFTPTAGDESGHTFLVVDANGVAGYQSGVDYVFELDGAKHLSNLDKTDFTV
ncbi:MAG TPA: M10 family metallopeptidase [Rhizomicrobium sp.]|jgi:hypothetical protein|nr:M10 family metallopeptidase [Rhizomicrobium sp.]